MITIDKSWLYIYHAYTKHQFSQRGLPENKQIENKQVEIVTISNHCFFIQRCSTPSNVPQNQTVTNNLSVWNIECSSKEKIVAIYRQRAVALYCTCTLSTSSPTILVKPLVVPSDLWLISKWKNPLKNAVWECSEDITECLKTFRKLATRTFKERRNTAGRGFLCSRTITVN